VLTGLKQHRNDRNVNTLFLVIMESFLIGTCAYIVGS